jgi:hypothetical protein
MPSTAEFDAPLARKKLVQEAALLVPMLMLVWVVAVSLVSHCLLPQRAFEPASIMGFLPS